MKVWLIGSGTMSLSYTAVLKAMDVDLCVIGRGQASAAAFEQACGVPVSTGGLAAFIAAAPQAADAAIVSVGVEALFDTTRTLLEYGVKRILVEKPGALHLAQIEGLRALAAARRAEVLIGYNRRYYSSARAVRELAAADGGIESAFFEFTEWGHEIATLQKGEGVKERWLLSNSSHVIDLVFNLIGAPAELHAATRGTLDWHPSAAVFVGSGISERGVPFAYHSNWDAPGRWGVELVSKNFRFFLRPMESVQMMRKGSVAIEPVELNDGLDKQYKPGLYLQVADFLAGKSGELCTLDQQVTLWPAYCKIGSYLP